MARQEKELDDQRKQFEAERADQQKQIEAQRQQFEAQQESIRRQNFESSFFQLLRMQSQILQEMKWGQGHTGKACFEAWYSGFGNDFVQWLIRHNKNQPPQPGQREQKDLVVGFFLEYYQTREPQMGPYFRNLYHIIKFVKGSAIEPKRRYTSLARAQLSKFDLFFLFYNCLTPYGQGFKPLVEEFGLLEHLDKKLLLDSSHEQFYAATAYQ